MLHALVIGVDAPRDPRVRPLEHARADAEGVAAALHDRAESERQIHLFVGEQATKPAVARAITEELPRCVDPSDTVLLYFAGYGSPELERDFEPSLHLVLADTELARLPQTSMDLLAELGPWIRRLPARVVVIVLDASFNGMPGGRTFEGPGLRRGPRLRALDRLSPSRAGVGGRFAILTASTDKEVAREDTAYEHGVFTHHLIAALRGPDLEGRAVTASMLHAAVAEPVRASTGGRQNPALHGGASHVPLLVVRPDVTGRASSGATGATVMTGASGASGV